MILWAAEMTKWNLLSSSVKLTHKLLPTRFYSPSLTDSSDLFLNPKSLKYYLKVKQTLSWCFCNHSQFLCTHTVLKLSVMSSSQGQRSNGIQHSESLYSSDVWGLYSFTDTNVCMWSIMVEYLHAQSLMHVCVHILWYLCVSVLCVSWQDSMKEHWDSPLGLCWSILDQRRWLSRLESFRAPGTSDSPSA